MTTNRAGLVTSRPQSHADSVSKFVDASLHSPAGVLVKDDVFALSAHGLNDGAECQVMRFLVVHSES